jgi:hypothetical protein
MGSSAGLNNAHTELLEMAPFAPARDGVPPPTTTATANWVGPVLVLRVPKDSPTSARDRPGWGVTVALKYEELVKLRLGLGWRAEQGEGVMRCWTGGMPSGMVVMVEGWGNTTKRPSKEGLLSPSAAGHSCSSHSHRGRWTTRRCWRVVPPLRRRSPRQHCWPQAAGRQAWSLVHRCRSHCQSPRPPGGTMVGVGVGVRVID